MMQVGTHIRTLVVAMALACAVGAVHAAPYDPARDWRTLETEHFRVHFHGDMEPMARRVAAIAEAVHVNATDALGWAPRRRTEVVLVDDTDLANGYAMSIPFSMMAIYVAPPEPGSLLQVDGHDRWLEFLVVHEYTHIVHGDMATGLPARLRRVFGRQLFTFPHLMQPLWLVEGLATYFETDRHDQVGRGQSALTDMVLRAEVAAGIRPLAQVNAPNRSWPAGQVPYLYGVAFYQFLEDVYGPALIREYISDYAGNFVPFAMDASARRVFGRDLPTLWNEFEAWLFERHGPTLNALRAAGLRDGEALTGPGAVGLHEGGVLQADDDGAIYYVADTGEHRPRLVRRHRDGRVERLAKLNRGARFSVHGTAGVMIAQPEHCDEYRVYYDLYLLVPGSGGPERLTRCSRYRDVAWHPDGEALAAVRIAAGRSSLHLITARGASLEVLYEAEDGGLIAHPHWSPDGTRLVVVRTRPGRGGALYEYTVATGEWRRVTDEGSDPVRPRYTRDGAHILFSSDHGGIYDIRRLTRASGLVSTLTRVETGAFDAVDGPDGVHFLLYGPDGYGLRRLGHAAPVGRLPAGGAARAHPDEPVLADGTVRSYDPLQTLPPTAWAPYLHVATDVAELGAFVWGRDALGIHGYAVLPAVDIERGSLVGSAAYVWADRVFVEVERWTDATPRGVVRDDAFSLAWRIPRTQIHRDWNWFLGASTERTSDLALAPGVQPLPSRTDNLVGVALVHDSARRYRLSFTRQEGRHVRAVAEHSVGGADFSGGAWTLDWREFLHLGGARVLALRFVHARGDERARPFRLGGPDTDEFMLLFSSSHGVFNKRDYPLRGYESHPALTGAEMQLVSAELRLPGRLFERARWPLGFDRWGGTVFVEAGGAANRAETLRLHAAAGAEAHLDLTLGYRFGGLRLRGGYARGFDDEVGGSDRVYMAVGAAF